MKYELAESKSLDDIATSIRGLNGGTEKYTVPKMAEAIGKIKVESSGNVSLPESLAHESFAFGIVRYECDKGYVPGSAPLCEADADGNYKILIQPAKHISDLTGIEEYTQVRIGNDGGIVKDDSWRDAIKKTVIANAEWGTLSGKETLQIQKSSRIEKKTNVVLPNATLKAVEAELSIFEAGDLVYDERNDAFYRCIKNYNWYSKYKLEGRNFYSGGIANMSSLISDGYFEAYEVTRSYKNVFIASKGNVELRPSKFPELGKLIDYFSFSIPDGLFDGDEILTYASYPNATEVGIRSFFGCKMLTDIDVPVAYDIDCYAFHGCTSLKKVTLPAARRVQTSAFQDCTALEEFHAPDLFVIDSEAFSGCTSLKVAELGSAETSADPLAHLNKPAVISQLAFKDCKSLEAIQLYGAQHIDHFAFAGCTSLERAALPQCFYLSASAFDSCPKLSLIFLPTLSSVEGKGTTWTTKTTKTIDATEDDKEGTETKTVVNGNMTEERNSKTTIGDRPYTEGINPSVPKSTFDLESYPLPDALAGKVITKKEIVADTSDKSRVAGVKFYVKTKTINTTSVYTEVNTGNVAPALLRWLMDSTNRKKKRICLLNDKDITVSERDGLKIPKVSYNTIHTAFVYSTSEHTESTVITDVDTSGVSMTEPTFELYVKPSVLADYKASEEWSYMADHIHSVQELIDEGIAAAEEVLGQA